MNKFIGKKTVKKTTKKTVKVEAPKEVVAEVIKKGVKEFVICPKCRWQHKAGTEKCRFCGKKLGE